MYSDHNNYSFVIYPHSSVLSDLYESISSNTTLSEVIWSFLKNQDNATYLILHETIRSLKISKLVLYLSNNQKYNEKLELNFSYKEIKDLIRRFGMQTLYEARRETSMYFLVQILV